jgi:hypothetical protein
MTTDQDDDNEDSHSSSDTSSEEDEPPIMELFYRRTCKDKVKLIVIPLLYFMFFAIAGVFAFYSIEALVLSYNHRVRTASYITVEEYAPIGIAVFPQDFATYEGCQFKYGDDLSPHGGNWTPLTPADVLDNCSTFINVTFTSSLVNENRTAMVFRGPTRVNLKQSLWLNFSIDTTKREFGAMEFLIFSDWRDLNAMTAAQRASYLAQEEAKEPLYTLPAGFRSWVKIYKIMRHDGATKTNLSDFYLITDFSKYNDPRPPENRTSDPLLVLFEWKSPTYEYIEDILSTTIWNTLGSLAGVFVTLIKAGEYFYAWVKRMRRERRKKLLKLQEMEEERQRMMAEYELKREERRRQKLAESQEKLNNVVKEGVMSQ